MISVIVMLNLEKSKVNIIAKEIADMQGVQEVFSVAGRYDLVITIKVKNHENIAEIVTDKILKIDGITKSETLISFRVFSNDDRNEIFSAGM